MCDLYTAESVIMGFIYFRSIFDKVITEHADRSGLQLSISIEMEA